MQVTIVEDVKELREGLAYLIGHTGGFQCTATFASIEDLLDAHISRPDVILLDIGLPGMSGIEGIPLLTKRWPASSIVMLTVFGDDVRITQAICAGAHGYLLKKTPPAKIIEALQQVLDGGSPMSPEIARRVLQLYSIARAPAKKDYELSVAEGRLLGMLVEGHSYKTAAAELRVSVNTVAFHVRHIYEKLAVHSKSEAVSKALRENLFR